MLKFDFYVSTPKNILLSDMKFKNVYCHSKRKNSKTFNDKNLKQSYIEMK